ncbi:MAG: acyltransferase [Dehalogenimonas sp.]
MNAYFQEAKSEATNIASKPLSPRRRFKALLFNFRKVARYVIASSLYDENTVGEYFRSQGAEVGFGCRIFIRHLGDEPYLVKIGDHVTIAAGVTFITHDGGAWIGRLDIPDLQVFGPINIGNNCVIGQNAILFPNITIGDNCIVGAGSVVISNIPSNTLAMGVPARPFGSVNKYLTKCIERWKIQKPPDVVIEPGADWWNSRNYNNNRIKLKKHLTSLFSANAYTQNEESKNDEGQSTPGL